MTHESVSNLYISLELHAHISKCLWGTFTWMFSWYLKHLKPIFKIELHIFPQTRLSFNPLFLLGPQACPDFLGSQPQSHPQYPLLLTPPHFIAIRLLNTSPQYDCHHSLLPPTLGSNFL